MRIAVVGSGISGLAAAWLMARDHSVTLYEAGGYLGGHTHTVDVTLDGVTHGVDTGFLVFNGATYPNLVPMLEHLGVPVARSEMTFSLALQDPAIEWAGTSLGSLFAQRSNLVRPGFLRMLRDLLRFNREAAACAARQESGDPAPAVSIGVFLKSGGYSAEFRDWYLMPMAAAIWSCPTRTMLGFPFASFARFFRNHGLLKLVDRPQWYTVDGGARRYVEKLASALQDVRLHTPVVSVVRDSQGVDVASESSGATRTERFDALVLGCHSNQALRILGDGATTEEKSILGAIPYQHNRALLHTDASLLPANRRVWSAWNYAAGRDSPDGRPVSVHYLINRLQPLPFGRPVIVTLNPFREPAAATVIGEYDYEHPVFAAGAEEAQARLPSIQGSNRTWYCGAWTRYGFHEDGLASALGVANCFGIAPPWAHSQAVLKRAA
jgi:predicted NAD/FAD-binding protein